MSILRSLERRGADPLLPWGSSFIPTNAMSGLSAAGIAMNDDAALSISTVYTCVAILADAISTLDFDVYRTNKAGTKKKIDNQPPIVKDPWPEGSPQDWLTQVMVSLTLRGNFYGLIRDRDERGYPTMIQPIHPDRVTARRSERTGLRIYRVQGTVVPTEDMLHIPALLVPGSFIGLNPVEYVRSSWAISAAAEKYAGSFFSNSANPSGMIMFEEDLSPEEALELKRDWQQMHGGLGNAQFPAVLTGGAKWQQISINPDDAQFLQTRDFQRHEIGTFFRIPEHMLGYQDRTSSWGAGIEQMSIGFGRYTMRPWVNRIEGALTRIMPDNLSAQFDYKSLLRGDSIQRATVWTMARNGGWMNIDEIRAEEDMAPLPDGKGQDYWAPLNFAPVEQVANPQQDTSGGSGLGGIGGGVGNSPTAPPAPSGPK